MKHLLIVLIALTLSAFDIARAQGGIDELTALEHERLRALVDGDMASADSLHADDFRLINPFGGTLTKEEYLGAIASGEVDYLAWNPGPIEVRYYTDAAVLQYQAEIQIKVRSSPNAPQGRFWHTDVYEKRDGHWQVVWSQATQIR